ncbi:hypothetical protein PHYPO_G00145060 [Pangasianodon hypophthalmus]|uniref:Uncharacterized protein n=1 Tax=Pangasianodon hypophthalmus TaxID=310915 RepID=A0A5N5K324_PANHP|nr:hypothetical protein PHYPO_G00145060 [Pangasianodon hypophthalmus]
MRQTSFNQSVNPAVDETHNGARRRKNHGNMMECVCLSSGIRNVSSGFNAPLPVGGGCSLKLGTHEAHLPSSSHLFSLIPSRRNNMLSNKIMIAQ